MPRSDSPVKPPIDETQRSRVAPVTREINKSSDDFSADIKKLLAGLEPKIASEAIARAETLGKLPAEQQTLLRCALSAASESFKKVELIQDELAKVKAHQQRAETDLLVESQALCRRSALAEAQVAGLREDLAASVAANYAGESRSRRHRRFLWLALGATVSAGFVCTLLLSRQPPQSSAPAPEPSTSEPSTRPPPDRDPVVEQTLDRFDGALARVPLIEIDNVLRQANQWLIASRNPPCFVQLTDGEVSLLVLSKGRPTKPLAAALARCADAVEHVTD